MNLSNQFVLSVITILVIFSYFQGVVVPNVEQKYLGQAAVYTSSTKQTVKALPALPTPPPCNPTFEHCGGIKIIKNTNPDNYQDFTFTHNIPGYPTTFVLDDDSALVSPSALTNSKGFYTPWNGTFTISEVLITGYTVTITCIDPSGGTSTTATTASISILNGESVTCTFLNQKDGTGPTIPPLPVVCTSDTWIAKANPLIYFNNVVNFVIGTTGYIGTGYSGVEQSYFTEFNPVTNTWTQKADFGGGPRSEAVSFSIGTKGYVGTGFGNALQQQDLWEYNPVTDTWTQKADLPGGPRLYAVGFSIGTKGYIGTGFHYGGLGTEYQDFWEYNPTTNTWTQKADFGGGPRYYAVGFSIGGKGYIGTGQSDWTLFPPLYYQDFWEYDPVTDTWTQKADFAGVPRYQATGFSIGTKGYIGTGYNYPAGTLADFWEYNPVTDIWTAKANYGNGAMSDGTGFSLNSKGYMYGGYSSNFWEYCP